MGTFYSPRITRRGLISCFDVANKKSYPGTGTSIVDLHRGTTGSLMLGPTYSESGGTGLVFDNVDDYVDAGFLPQQTDSPLSVFAWVYLNATPAAGVTNGIWGHYGLSSVNCHFETYTTYTRVRLGTSNNVSLPVLPAGVWSHVGFTSSGSNHSYYVNGTLQATWSGVTGAILGDTGSSPSHMWGRSDGLRTWNGKISMVTVNLVELTATEVDQNFQAMRGRYGV